MSMSNEIEEPTTGMLKGTEKKQSIVKKPKKKYLKLRKGRGFSFTEIKSAGIPLDDAKNLSLPIDTRRKSLHDENVKLLSTLYREIVSTRQEDKIHLEVTNKEAFKELKELHSFLPLLFNNTLPDILDDDGIFFLGLPNHDIEDIFSIVQLSDHGWIIRNMIVVPQGNDWIPIFMMVKDIKSIRYKFNLDNIRVNHQYENIVNWNVMDFIGYRVEKSQALFKKPDTGLIGKILSYHPNGLPHWVVVKWKSGKHSVEEIITSSKGENAIQMFCPECKTKLKNYHHYKKSISCPSCLLQLWRDVRSIPKLLETNPPVKPEYQHEEITILQKKTKKDYNGKFKYVDRINIGQSPGARVSVYEQFFTTKRYYKIKQSMISDYLNLHRIKNGLTKNALTNRFPPEYKHTVGHWIRKDMGGSLPKYEDLMTLNEYLHLDQSYINCISRIGLKLQTVIADVKGKNPGDFLDFPLPKVINMLKRVRE